MFRVHIPEDVVGDPAAYALTHYAPKMSAALLNYSAVVYENTALSLREMEGARYRTALINGCSVCKQGRALKDFDIINPGNGLRFERPMHTRGDAPDEAFYQAVPEWRSSPLFSARERLAIDFAERMGEKPRSMEDDEGFWAEMKANFSDEELVDLTLSVGSWIAVGRTAHILGLDSICQITEAV